MYSFLVEFFHDLNKFNTLNTQKEKTKKKKTNVYDTASAFYHDLLETPFDEYYDLPDAERTNMEHRYKPKKLFLEAYNYDDWFENEKSTDTTSRKSDKEEPVDLSNIPPPPLEGDEEVKEGKE